MIGPKKVTEVKKSSAKEESIENDNLDNSPPGSASIRDRGVPTRAANESRQGGTTARPPAMEAPAEPDAQIIKTMPYKAPNALSEARSAVRAGLRGSTVNVGQRARSVGGKSKNALSAKGIAALIRTESGVNAGTTADSLMDALEVDDVNTRREVKELLKHPELFVGDSKPANLQVLSLPPDGQKPPEFDAAPGTDTIPDTRYYPTRYAIMPSESNFETGDLIYNVHENGNFTVLSKYQQTQEWQASHDTPPMNLISVVGGGEQKTVDTTSKSDLVNKTEEVTGKKEVKK